MPSCDRVEKDVELRVQTRGRSVRTRGTISGKGPSLLHFLAQVPNAGCSLFPSDPAYSPHMQPEWSRAFQRLPVTF